MAPVAANWLLPNRYVFAEFVRVWLRTVCNIVSILITRVLFR